jgi:hypothetical protein
MSGRKSYKPTVEDRNRVETLSGMGIKHDDICCLIMHANKPISLKTLYKYFRLELDRGKAKANSSISQALYRKAQAGDVAAQIFWLKAQCGWSEKHRVELTGKDGAPIEQNTNVKISDEQLERVARKVESEF